MTLNNKIELALNGKIEAVFLTFQKELGINSGDIDPIDHLELIQATEVVVDIIEKVLNKQKEGK